MWSDWLVVWDCGFHLSALWCPLSVPAIWLGFLLPWTCGISLQLLQQRAAAAPYLAHGVVPLSYCPWPCTWVGSSQLLLCHCSHCSCTQPSFKSLIEHRNEGHSEAVYMTGQNHTCLQRQKDQATNYIGRLPRTWRKGERSNFTFTWRKGENRTWLSNTHTHMCAHTHLTLSKTYLIAQHLVQNIKAVNCGNRRAKKGWCLGTGNAVSFRGNERRPC